MRAFVRYGRETQEVLDAVLIGRSSSCDIVLVDDVASREHCRVERDGDRALLRDLGSRNGVRVNGQEITGPRELHHGDVLTVGASRLVFLWQSTEPTSSDRSNAQTREGDIEPQDGAILGDLLRRTRSALANGDVVQAEANARGLLAVIRAGTVSETLRGDATELLLALSNRSHDVFWLERLVELHLLWRHPISTELAEAIRVSARGARLGAVVDDYLAVASRIPTFSPAAAERLRSLLGPRVG